MGRLLRCYSSPGLSVGRTPIYSGVLLIDVAAWNEEGWAREVVDFLRANSKKYDGADQASLNVVFYKRFFPLRIRYNKRAGPGTRLEKKHTTDGILHFVGIPKPWDIGGRWFNKNYHLYEKYRRQAGVPGRSTLDLIWDTGWRRAAKGLVAGLRGTIR